MKLINREFLLDLIKSSSSAEIDEGILALNGFYGSNDGTSNRNLILKNYKNNKFIKWAMFTIFAPLNTLGDIS